MMRAQESSPNNETYVVVFESPDNTSQQEGAACPYKVDGSTPKPDDAGTQKQAVVESHQRGHETVENQLEADNSTLR